MKFFNLFHIYCLYSNVWRVLVTIMPLYIGLVLLLIYNNLGSQINQERKALKELESEKSTKLSNDLNSSGRLDSEGISDVYTFTQSEGNEVLMDNDRMSGESDIKKIQLYQ